jgi:hypothetical protein
MKQNTGTGPRTYELTPVDDKRECQMSSEQDREEGRPFREGRESPDQEEPSENTASDNSING